MTWPESYFQGGDFTPGRKVGTVNGRDTNTSCCRLHIVLPCVRTCKYIFFVPWTVHCCIAQIQHLIGQVIVSMISRVSYRSGPALLPSAAWQRFQSHESLCSIPNDLQKRIRLPPVAMWQSSLNIGSLKQRVYMGIRYTLVSKHCTGLEFNLDLIISPGIYTTHYCRNNHHNHLNPYIWVYFVIISYLRFAKRTWIFRINTTSPSSSRAGDWRLGEPVITRDGGCPSLMPTAHQVEGLELMGRAYKCGYGKEGVGETQEKSGEKKGKSWKIG